MVMPRLTRTVYGRYGSTVLRVTSTRLAVIPLPEADLHSSLLAFPVSLRREIGAVDPSTGTTWNQSQDEIVLRQAVRHGQNTAHLAALISRAVPRKGGFCNQVARVFQSVPFWRAEWADIPGTAFR